MKFASEIHVGDRRISADNPTFIIAEAGVNHGGDMDLARTLIDIAVDAGADAVKFQTFKAEHLILPEVVKAPYQLKTTDATESQFSMLKRLEVTREQNLALREYSIDKGIIFLTTPFDEQSLRELDELDLPAYKIASTDITNLPFLREIARREKPMFLSTGMAYLSEVEMALREIHRYNKDVVLMQCTANYPINDNEANLSIINTYRDNFDVILGYSDHSVGVGAAPFAVPMGARVLEKHFTTDKSLEGPDHKASLDPVELRDFVALVRKVEEYMGTDVKAPTLSERNTRASLQKSFVARRAIAKGEKLSWENLTAKRSGGNGISPLYYRAVFGTAAVRDFAANELIEV